MSVKACTQEGKAESSRGPSQLHFPNYVYKLTGQMETRCLALSQSIIFHIITWEKTTRAQITVRHQLKHSPKLADCSGGKCTVFTEG